MLILRSTLLLAATLTLIFTLVLNWGIENAPHGSPMFAFSADAIDRSQQDVYLADLRLRLVHNLTLSPNNDSAPLWSPQGDRLAYTTRTDANHLVIMAFPDGEITEMPRFVGYFDPAWTNDGGAILVTKQEYNEGAGNAQQADQVAYRLQPDGEITRLDQEGTEARAYFERSRAGHVSPDGRYAITAHGMNMAVVDQTSEQVVWTLPHLWLFNQASWRP